MSKYLNLGLGGTFDRLHTGHKLILDLASFYSENIQIGLIDEKYLLNNPKELGRFIQPYKKRHSNLTDYLQSRNRRCSIVKIDTLGKDKEIASRSDLTALLVSQETYSGALAINNQRKMSKKAPVMIILSPIVTADNGKKLSSSNIRESLVEKGEHEIR